MNSLSGLLRLRNDMGKENAEKYGRINSGEGAVLVRIKPTRIIAEKDTAVLS